MFFKLLREALKVKQVRSKILFTIFIVLVFRIGTSITVPGVNANSLKWIILLKHVELGVGECPKKLFDFCPRS